MNARRMCSICRNLTLPSHLEKITIQVGTMEDEDEVCLSCAKVLKSRDSELERIRKEETVNAEAREAIKVAQSKRDLGSGAVQEVYDAITTDELAPKGGETLDIF